MPVFRNSVRRTAICFVVSVSALMLTIESARSQTSSTEQRPSRIEISMEVVAKDADSSTRHSQPRHRFKVTGLDARSVEAAKQQFVVRVVSQVRGASSVDSNQQVAAAKNLPPLIGQYEIQSDTVYFEPRFPLSPKLEYRVDISAATASDSDSTESKRRIVASKSFQIEAKKTHGEAKITHVYPSAESLPENLLKFYLHFSEPMNRGEAYQRIQLYRGDQLVDRPFLELGEELWNPDQTRFTLFIHPGLIKRGVKPREDQGPPLTTGATYRLTVDTGWTTAAGGTLSETFVKEFTVTKPDHDQPNLEEWAIQSPKSQTRDPVTLSFHEPLDQAMLSRVLKVKHQDGTAIAGQVSVSKGETYWEFTPENAWATGTYNIDVAANLEDLCGNSIARPFEVKMQDRSVANPSTKVAIEFIVR